VRALQHRISYKVTQHCTGQSLLRTTPPSLLLYCKGQALILPMYRSVCAPLTPIIPQVCVQLFTLTYINDSRTTQKNVCTVWMLTYVKNGRQGDSILLRLGFLWWRFCRAYLLTFHSFRIISLNDTCTPIFTVLHCGTFWWFIVMLKTIFFKVFWSYVSMRSWKKCKKCMALITGAPR
jgi:hypothetical protein